MTREHRQAEMEAFGAAVLAEDYGAVPEGWGLQQMCGAGFGAAALPEGWFKVKAGVYRKKEPSWAGGDYGEGFFPNVFTVKLSPKTKHRGKGWRVHEKGAKGSHTYWTAHPTATQAMVYVEERFYPPRKPKKSKPKSKKPWWRFGFGASRPSRNIPSERNALWWGRRGLEPPWVDNFGGKTAKDYEREGRAFGLKQARHARHIIPSPVTRGELNKGSWQFDAWVRGYRAGEDEAMADAMDAAWRKQVRQMEPGGKWHHLGRTRWREPFGQGPFPGVDTALQDGIRDYAAFWPEVALDVSQGNITEDEIEEATPDAAEAVITLQSAVNAIWGAAGQLEQTQRGRAQGARSRHRQLVADTRLLLNAFFRGAKDEEGRSLSWEDIVGDLPATSIGPAQFAFGEGDIPKFVEVESDSGMLVRLAIPSIITANDATILAEQVESTANDIRDLAFTWQSRGQGAPQAPSDFIMRSLSQQSSLVPSNVFTVGATRTSQCIRRKTNMGYPHRQAVGMCLNMGRARRLGPRGGYRKV